MDCCRLVMELISGAWRIANDLSLVHFDKSGMVWRFVHSVRRIWRRFGSSLNPDMSVRF